MERMAEIFAYVDDAEPYLKELSLESVARLVSEMDSDDAVDMLEELDEEEKSKILAMLDEEAGLSDRQCVSLSSRREKTITFPRSM